MAFKKGESGNVNGRPKGVKNRKPNMYKELYESIVGTFKTGGYYVYYHVMKGEIVYIGKGKNNRAWNFSNRSQEDVKEQLEVRIVCNSLSEEEALAIERQLIKIHNPKYNIAHSNRN